MACFRQGKIIKSVRVAMNKRLIETGKNTVNRNMEKFKFRRRVFLAGFSFLFFILVPAHCIAQNITEAESRVYRERLVTEAKKYIGAPYVRGAVGPDAFDCSGLVYTVSHDSIARQLPRTVKAMYSHVRIVPDDQKEPGDLVFFRTTGDGSISHVGLYIGNNQFISAVSDGPNTGVIVSSLKEGYWKGKYAACGKFLPPAGMAPAKAVKAADTKASKKSENEKAKANKSSAQKKSASQANSDSFMHYDGDGGFCDRLAFAAYTTTDWSLFTEKKFMINFRGLSTEADLIYRGKVLSPGIGLLLRWNYGVGAFQMPVIFSIYANEYFRAYAGPLFSFGNCTVPDSSTNIKASVFPGVIGVTFAAPSFTSGDFKVQLIQDICYSVYNNESNSALSALKAASAGLELCTGVRVMFPFSSCKK